MKYTALSPELFKANRKRFMAQMKPGCLAIFNANDQAPRSGDQAFAFRQNADLYYLCGIDQEETMLLLFPDCKKPGDYEEVLLIKRTNEHIAVWEGHKYTKEEATAASGISRVLFLDEAQGLINELIMLSEGIYVNLNENDRYVSEVQTRDQRFAARIRDQFPAHTLYRAQPIMKRLRMIKSRPEIDVIQHCVDITGIAFDRVLRFVKPGVWEYEIEAEIIHEFIRRRCTGHAYTPIIASGANACVLHYIENNRQCQDGEVLLMDFGCEYANYAADLSRSIPVSGRFTPRQRAVYDAVLRVMNEAKAMLTPGNTLDELNREVGKLMESELVGLGLLTPEEIAGQNPEWPAYKKYFMHGTSHHLGLDVHDLGLRYEPFQAGMVFTCEPGLYIPEENLGIRLENDILVTDNGPVDLFEGIPLLADEIEAIMSE